jgi:hypothetical protein
LIDSHVVGLFGLTLALIASTAAMTLRFQLHRTISITGTAFLAALLMHGVSAIPLAAGLIGQQFSLYPTPSPHYAWVVGASFIGFAAGAVALAARSSFDVTEAQTAWARRSLEHRRIRRAMLLIIGITIATALVVALPPGVSGLLTLAGGSPSAIYQFRQTSGQNLGLFAYPLSVFGGVVGPLLLLVTINLARSSLRQERLVVFVLLIAATTALLLISASTLQRAPIIFLLLFALMGWSVSSSQYPSAQRWVMAALAAIVLVGGAATYVFTYSIGGSEALREVLERLYLAPQQSLDAFLHIYPSEVAFSGGAGIGLISRVLRLPDYQSPALLAGYLSTDAPRIDLNCYWACDLWANFGYVGVVLGSFLVGGVLVSLDRWCLLGMKRTAAGCALYAFMLIQATQVASISFFTMLFSGGLILAPALAWVLEAVAPGSDGLFRIDAPIRRLGLAAQNVSRGIARARDEFR